MSKAIFLPRASLLNIRGNGRVYHGGSQDWYAQPWQRQAGCGPTSCAGLLWYLAQTREGCQPLCPYNAALKPGFVQLMNDVWHYLTPGAMGINSAKLFAQGAKCYGADRHVPLLAKTLNIPRLPGGTRNWAALYEFIASALAAGLPVAFLNLSNGTLPQLDSWHWVSLVALRADQALAYDKGRALWLNLRQWLATSLMGGGFVALEPMARQGPAQAGGKA